MTAPLRERALDYLAAGWPVLKLPPQRKESPPTGYTGADGKDADRATVVAWVESEPNGNVALRMPPDVIGIDVDAYNGKDGGRGLKELERELGELPPTWMSTSRTDGASGIRFYRVPTGTTFKDKPKPNIEILQRKHRYAVVWPSMHPEGRMYRWVNPDGLYADTIPTVDDLADLPAQWIDKLTERALPALERPDPKPRHGDRSRAVTNALADALTNFYGGRHDAALHGCMALLRLEHQEHPGASEALEDLRTAFVRTVTSDGTRKTADAEAEWKRMVDGARKRIATEPDKRPKYGDLVAPQPVRGVIVATEAPASGEWPEPKPIASTPAPEPFPVDCLPSWLGDYAASIATQLQTPVDLPAMMGLAALSMACNGSALVNLGGTWREGLNLYLVVALPPGAGKSPTFGPIFGPLRAWDNQRRIDAAPRILEAESDLKRAEEALRKAEKADDAQGVSAAIKRKLAITVPAPPRLIVDDATPEAMVKVMAGQGGRLALISSEGGPFEMMTGRYSDKANLEPYLKAWSGDSIDVDRMGRESLSMESARLVIGLTVQPQVISALADKPELAGKGLTARFMYSVPASLVGKRNMRQVVEPDHDAQERYASRIVSLARTRWSLETADLRVTPEALEAFYAWRQEIEQQRGEDGRLYVLAEWTTKLESSVARVAGLLHLAENEDGRPISLETMQRALRIGRYWLSHAWLVTALWSPDVVAERAERIAKWIIRNDLERFSARDAQRARLLGRTTTDGGVEALAEPLQLLMDHGYIRGDFEGPVVLGVRGKASPEFITNPRWRVVTSCRATGVTPVVGHVGHVTEDRIQNTHSLTLYSEPQAAMPGSGDMADMADNPLSGGGAAVPLSPPPQPPQNEHDEAWLRDAAREF